MLVEATAEALEQKVQKAHEEIRVILFNLGEQLSSYGLRGNCSMTIDVVVHHKEHGAEEATVKRGSSYRF